MQTVERTLGNRELIRLIAPAGIQAKQATGATGGDAFEKEAGHAADLVSAGSTPTGTPARGASMASGRGFVVEDDSDQEAGQMRRTEFLAAVRHAVCDAADKSLEPSGRTSQDCPWIEYWLRHYGQRDAQHLNRTLREIAPETAAAPDAGRAVAMIAARVRRSVGQYVRTGELSGIPDGFTPELPGTGLLGSLFGRLLLKGRPGGPISSAQDPHMVKALLGSGEPLGGTHRSRMEAVFATGFSHVRLHRDATGSGLSERFQARAFTVGEHIAFAAGEYRPGTVAGDALLAHELAHTMQQANGRVANDVSVEALESDADRSAVEATSSLWAGQSPEEAPAPRLLSGLRLSRCGGDKTSKTPAAPKAETMKPDAAQQEASDDNPPDPENSYWFQDPKKQVPDDEGDQSMDFSKGAKEQGNKITSTAQTRQQVLVDKPADFSSAGGVVVRFAYPASSMASGKQSTQLTNAKSAVLDALTKVFTGIDALGSGAIEWENAKEKAEKLKKRNEEETQRARLKEVLKGFTTSHPLNVYLAPETRKETISGQYFPITAQVWVNMADVGDATKLQTAMRLPFQHILGGPNPAKGKADAPADMPRTMLHEGLHTLLANRGADSFTAWKEAESKMKIEGPEEVKKLFRNLVRGYMLSQEELFAYNNEESLYGASTGEQQGGKVLYEIFMGGVDLFYKRKNVSFTTINRKLDVGEKVEKKTIPWEVSYKYPAAITLGDSDKASIETIMMAWPMK
ncbi:MAG: DUF4157 domain-containing protein [Bryobacteraceae bacterium]